MEITINDVAAYLDHVGLQFMATIGTDGKPKVRPMQYMVLEDGKLWFCTNSKKDVYAELQANPSLELCGSKLEKEEIKSAWIRLSAEAVFVDSRKIRELIVEKSDIVRSLYANDLDNPIFKTFYIKNIKGIMTNLGHVKGLEANPEFNKPITFEFD